MGSKSLLKTNVALTTNIKLVVASDYKLYLESIDSHSQLSDTRYKHFLINKDIYLSDVYPVFYKNTPVDIAYNILSSNDKDSVLKDYKDQYDFTYNAGSNYISDTFYNEEFEYFAPLYIDGDIPENFIIFRIDNPGLLELDKTNFRSEIIDKWKCVTYFDLKTSILGEFLQRNITDNKSFPISPLELDVRKNEFSNWNGINYETGGYSSKSLFMEDVLENENTYYDFDKLITDGWKNNKVIFPNIMNFNFLFDDTPATKEKLRKWSINRYCGFYIDKKYTELIVTPYQPSNLISGFKILADNIVVDSTNISIDPILRGWKNDFYYIEYLGEFYRLIKYQDSNNLTVYKIVSDLDLSGQELLINKNIITIDQDNYLTYNTSYNANTFDIPNFEDWDICLIDIDKKWHIIKKDTTGYKIQSDYSFTISYDKLTYFINQNDSSYTTTVNLNDVDDSNKPIKFDIFFCNLTDIYDIDNDIVDTKYAEYEYSKSITLNKTEESKLLREDLRSKTIPKEIDTYIYNNEYITIPVSSEYVATSEIFEINSDKLTGLWNKNPNFVKWGYKNSLSTYDYKYRLNNSFKSEDYNRDVNTDLILPNRFERNLDYFYTINSGLSGSLVDYSFQSLNINFLDSNNLIESNTFNINKYFNTGTYSGNYFKYFFSKSDYLDNNDVYYNTNKYSTYTIGGTEITNSTVFRGIKFNIYDVKKVYLESGNISSFALKPTSTFDEYDFSILLSRNDINPITQASVSNLSDWDIIESFDLDQTYQNNEYVLFNEMLFKSIGINTISDPNFSPSTSVGWTHSLVDDIFYNQFITYGANTYVYNDNDFWISQNGLANTNSTLVNFWLDNRTYGVEEGVLYKHKYYISITTSNVNKQPTNTLYWTELLEKNDYTNYDINSYVISGGTIYKSNITNNIGPGLANWTSLSKVLKWVLVPHWLQSTLSYSISSLVQLNNTIYQKINVTTNGDLSNATLWTKLYSLNTEANKLYSNTKANNNIVFMNNRFYRYKTATFGLLDNGINIFINKKWKNILINIYINDNTTPYITEYTRDIMYQDINMKLTAKNFMDSINDISNTYGFLNNINYFIINEDLTYQRYTLSNISDIPYLITCQRPDTFKTKFNSYKTKEKTLDPSIYKVKNKLTDNIINNIPTINYYDNSPLAVEFIKNKNEVVTTDNYSGVKNVIDINLFRFNGYYEPILSKVDLFKSFVIDNDGIKNKKFDESLTNFGLAKELIYSKVNVKDSPLKLKNFKNVKSIYPMIDEFGYSYKDFFIFKSTWDFSYYTSTR